MLIGLSDLYDHSIMEEDSHVDDRRLFLKRRQRLLGTVGKYQRQEDSGWAVLMDASTDTKETLSDETGNNKNVNRRRRGGRGGRGHVGGAEGGGVSAPVEASSRDSEECFYDCNTTDTDAGSVDSSGAKDTLSNKPLGMLDFV